MASNDGKNPQQFPKLTAVRGADSEIKSVMSKLVHDPTGARRSSSDQKHLPVSRWSLDRIANKTAQNVIDSDSIGQTLPDIELTEQVMIGSILSPKDMSTANITFATAENQFDGEIGRPMLDVIERHFKHDYKIDERLDLDLQQALMTKGAHIKAVLPENNLDMIINGSRKLSMEQFRNAISRAQFDKQLGFLGHPTTANIGLENFNGPQLTEMVKVKGAVTVSLEDGKTKTVMETLPGVTVTDNFNVLKGTDFKRRKRELSISDKLTKLRASVEEATQGLLQPAGGVQVDATQGLTSKQIDELYRRSTPHSQQTQVLVGQAFMERPSVGHPLVIDLPVEAVVPVYVPGKPEEHVGYFVLLDQFGRPLCKSDGKDYYGEMRTSFSANSKDNSSELLRMTRDAMGNGKQESTFELDQVYQTYEGILENDLQNRLRNGMYDEEMSIGFTEEIKRIMLYRSFKAQNTQLLYIPAELVTYIAFNYSPDGIGETLLARSKILANMRSILLFAETMSGVRNAIGRKKVSITTDPDDPDPQQTISDIQSIILEQSHRGFPLGAPDPSQSLDYLNRAGIDFAIDSQSDGYANTKVEWDDYTTQQQAGNPELQDKLRRMHAAAMGVPPDLVDPTSSPDFAVSVVNNNLIMTRRVKFYQRVFTGHYSKFVRCYTQHSSILLAELMEVYEANKTKLTPEQLKQAPDEVIQDFINAIVLQLPEPDNTQLEIQSEAFEKYNTMLDAALGAHINEDMFSDESMGDKATMVAKATAAMKAYFQRQFLARNNILPELDILSRMDDEKPAFNLLDAHQSMVKSLGTALEEYFKGMAAQKAAWEAAYPAADGMDGAEAGDGVAPDGTEGGEAGLDDGMGGGLDDGGGSLDDGEAPAGDDFGMDSPSLDGAAAPTDDDEGSATTDSPDNTSFDSPSLDGTDSPEPGGLTDSSEAPAEDGMDATSLDAKADEPEPGMEPSSLDAPEAASTAEPEATETPPAVEEEPEVEEAPVTEEPEPAEELEPESLDEVEGSRMEQESQQAQEELAAKKREEDAEALEKEEAEKAEAQGLEAPDLDAAEEEEEVEPPVEEEPAPAPEVPVEEPEKPEPEEEEPELDAPDLDKPDPVKEKDDKDPDDDKK